MISGYEPPEIFQKVIHSLLPTVIPFQKKIMAWFTDYKVT